MPANDYHLVSHWSVPGKIQDVYDVLSDAKGLPRWWPATYLDVLEIQSGGPDDVHKVVRIEARGWLPYKLNFHFAVTDSDEPHGFGLKAWGDLEGVGRWTLVQAGDSVDVSYDWRVRAQKPILRWTSALMKPVFAANHRWSMARGEESLRLEMQRRMAATDADRDLVPAPPRPAPSPPAPVLLGVGMLVAIAMLRRRRR